MGEVIYNYFSYKGDIIGYEGQDFMSPKQFIVMGVLMVALIVICILCRNIDKKYVGRYLKIIAIVLPVLEIIKITWETVHDIKSGEGFNWAGNLSFYPCSLAMFILPVAAWGKGKAKEFSLACTTCFAAFTGLTNFVYLNILQTYPIFTFAATHSVIYHFVLVFNAAFILATGYYKPQLKDLWRSLVPVWIFATLVIPVNIILQYKGYPANYMMLTDGWGLPVLQNIADALNSVSQGLFTLFMLAVSFPVVNGVTYFGIWGLRGIFGKIFKKKKAE